MNQQQKNYLVRRIETMAKEKKEAIKQEVRPTSTYYSSGKETLYHFMPKPKKQTVLEVVYNAIENGSTSINLSEFYDSDLIHSTIKENEKFNEKQRMLVEERKAKIDAKARAITDQIQFGDSEEALRMIQEFEKFEV